MGGYKTKSGAVADPSAGGGGEGKLCQLVEMEERTGGGGNVWVLIHFQELALVKGKQFVQKIPYFVKPLGHPEQSTYDRLCEVLELDRQSELTDAAFLDRYVTLKFSKDPVNPTRKYEDSGGFEKTIDNYVIDTIEAADPDAVQAALQALQTAPVAQNAEEENLPF